LRCVLIILLKDQKAPVPGKKEKTIDKQGYPLTGDAFNDAVVPIHLVAPKKYYLLPHMKVLLVEDDRKISAFIQKGLKEQGFDITACEDGDEGYYTATTQAFDAIILDIMLPGRDGLSILRNLRERKNTVPVILLTARSALNERLEGLNLGADDYLCKPFFIEELAARVHAVSRRASGETLNLLQCGELVVDLIKRKVTYAEQAIELTAREFSLLELLMRSPDRVYTRTQILEHVWGYDFDPQTNVVDVYIRRLRNKIKEFSSVPMIETVRGVGYRLKAQAQG
jgi:two-component system OmpR family response regulator